MKSKIEIPYLAFDGIHNPIEDELIEAATDVIRNKWYILGSKVEQFEQEFAKYSGTQFAVGVNSGLDGLVIALECLDIGKGDEVIVASNAYVACWNAITAVGAKIIPVEPSPFTHNIDIGKIEEKISKRTKAIMAVHLYGQMCDMSTLSNIAKKHDIAIVEDNAQSQGAMQSGHKSASFGQISSTSFYPGKNLGALGDAGVVTTNDPIMAEKARALRNYGSSIKYQNDYIGMNSRLDEIQAAFLTVKLRHLDQWNTERRKIANWYNEYLGYEWISTEKDNVCHIYCIQSDRRNELQLFLRENGIQTLIHYPIPPHLQKSYQFLGFSKKDFPIATKLSNQVLSLPIYPGLTQENVKYVVNCIYQSKIPLTPPS